MKKKFVQTEKLACWVTFTQVVEAESLEEAQELFDAGEGTSLGHKLGDNLGMVDAETEVLPIEETEVNDAEAMMNLYWDGKLDLPNK